MHRIGILQAGIHCREREAHGGCGRLPLYDGLHFVRINRVFQTEGARLIQAALGVTSAFVLYFLIYLVVPNRRMDVRETWPGALFAGVAFELLSLIFPVYIGLQPTINQYGRTFALLFVLLAYFFLLGIITMLGAEVNSVVALERSRREQAAAAADTEEAELAVSAPGPGAPRPG